MKVLFINPPQINFINYQKGWTFGLRDIGYYQPLGILYVATFLKNKVSDIKIKVIDAASPDMSYFDLENRIKIFEPDVIGISTYTNTFIDTLNITMIAKKINPDVHINLGGHHLSYFPKETLSHKSIDSIIIGEGEKIFSDLIGGLIKKTKIEEIEGVFTRNNLNKIEGYGNKYLNNLNELFYPDRNLLNEYKYYNVLTLDKKMTTIISSRGCPFQCNFCSLGRVPYRVRTSKDVVDEIEYCLTQGYNDFFFAEDTFNINNKKVQDFCNEILLRKLNIRWCCKARVSDLDSETLKLMAISGCYLINFGVETGSDTGLKMLKKGITTDQIKKVFDLCKKVKIKTMGYFMIGHPFEKCKKDVKKNIKFLFSLNPDYININTVNPAPFTPLFDEGVKKGLLDYESWKNMVLTGKKFIPKNWEEHFKKEELQKIRIICILKFYFRFSYIFKQLKNMENIKQFIYQLKVAKNIIFSIAKK